MSLKERALQLRHAHLLEKGRYMKKFYVPPDERELLKEYLRGNISRGAIVTALRMNREKGQSSKTTQFDCWVSRVLRSIQDEEHLF